ncbi:MAG: TIGR02281 family clan AA aspartic protease [Pseudomonadota bacterium]
MRVELVFGMVCVTSAVVAIRYIDRAYPIDPPTPQFQAVEPVSVARQLPVSERPALHNEVYLTAGYDRQFRVTAAVNLHPTNFLIDTGAAYVALRASDAARAGVTPRTEDYASPVSTANGITKAARILLDEIEIDGLMVRDVDAYILPDDQLSVNLLGMSFLSQLESVEARRDKMILRG